MERSGNELSQTWKMQLHTGRPIFLTNKQSVKYELKSNNPRVSQMAVTTMSGEDSRCMKAIDVLGIHTTTL